jgi:hypothetical protein
MESIELPNHKLHNRFAEALGIDRELADLVNKRMDQPSKWLGPSHRRVRHDIPYGVKMALEISQEQNLKTKTKHEVFPVDVMKAYGVHVLLDTASLSPSIRKMFKIMEAMTD